VQKKVAQVINPGVQFAQMVVQGEGKPRRRRPVPLVQSREHPTQVIPSEIPDMDVVLDKNIIVPIYETVVQDRQVNQKSRQGREEHKKPGKIPAF
jgi:hypothetical protein